MTRTEANFTVIYYYSHEFQLLNVIIFKCLTYGAYRGLWWQKSLRSRETHTQAEKEQFYMITYHLHRKTSALYGENARLINS